MGSAFGNDIIQMISDAGPMVRFVLLVLFSLSVISWGIIFYKFIYIKRARKETRVFQDLLMENMGMEEIYSESSDLEYSPVASLFNSGYREFKRIRKLLRPDSKGSGTDRQVPSISKQSIMANLERSLKKAIVDQVDTLEGWTGFLATTGNTAPFIGLFGTVWGIMQSFRGIGLKGSASLAVVAPGISEALIATAAGLAAAIPAVIAYNYFVNKIAGLKAEMDIFASDMLSTVERELF